MEKKLFNPFLEYGITDYKQYKDFPFLESKSISRLKNIINSQIQSNFRFPERLLILGEAGIGKSSSLFYIHDLLKNSGKCNVIFFSKLFTDFNDFKQESNEDIKELTKNPTYILVDFPDTISSINFKKFLDFLWSIITYENSQNISLIFSLNVSHFSRSFSFSEILGKFNKFRLDRLDLEESNKIIKSRLSMANINNFFVPNVYELIFKYSKGIPRNIICASKNLVDEFFNQESVTELEAKNLLNQEYNTQIIHDRIEDSDTRAIYEKVILIIDNSFGGIVTSQQDLIEKIQDEISIGRNKALDLIKGLNKFGLITITKGGINNTCKIIKLR